MELWCIGPERALKRAFRDHAKRTTAQWSQRALKGPLEPLRAYGKYGRIMCTLGIVNVYTNTSSFMVAPRSWFSWFFYWNPTGAQCYRNNCGVHNGIGMCTLDVGNFDCLVVGQGRQGRERRLLKLAKMVQRALKGPFGTIGSEKFFVHF